MASLALSANSLESCLEKAEEELSLLSAHFQQEFANRFASSAVGCPYI